MRIALEISYSSLNDPTRKRNHDPNSIKTAFWVMNPTLKIGMKLKKYDPNGAKCFVWVIKSIKQLQGRGKNRRLLRKDPVCSLEKCPC